MRPSGLLFLCAISTVAPANELVIRGKPIVVYDNNSTITAWPFFKRIEGKSSAKQALDIPAGAAIKPMTERLPLTPGRLRVGKPAIRMQAGQVVPLFIMGMDPVSLQWFDQAAEELAQMGARGVVVQATIARDWQALQRQAQNRGIDLILLPGDALAEGYRIDTYPMVIVSPEAAGQGADE